MHPFFILLMNPSSIIFIAIGAAAVGLGLYVLLDPASLGAAMAPQYRTIFAFLLLAYGLFRIWSGVNAMRRKQQRTRDRFNRR